MAAHRKVEAPVAALDGLLAVLRPAQIQVDELVAEGLLSHVLILLPVYCAHEVALLLEALGEVGGDEAAGTGHADLELRVALGELLLGHGRQNLRGEATRVGMLARHPVLVPARPRKCAQADRTPVRVSRVSRTGANVSWQAFVNRHAPWCRWVRLSHKSGRADKLRPWDRRWASSGRRRTEGVETADAYILQRSSIVMLGQLQRSIRKVELPAPCRLGAYESYRRPRR